MKNTLSIDLLRGKIGVLREFAEWLPGQRENFNWMEPCNCWMPMIPKYLNAFYGHTNVGIGASVLAFCEERRTELLDEFLAAQIFHPESIKALDDNGFFYEEIANFEFLIRFWKGETFKTVTVDYCNFNNGLTYVSEWIAHLEKELADMERTATRTTPNRHGQRPGFLA